MKDQRWLNPNEEKLNIFSDKSYHISSSNVISVELDRVIFLNSEVVCRGDTRLRMRISRPCIIDSISSFLHI